MNFKLLPLNFLKLGTHLPFDIHIQLSETKAVTLFRKESDFTQVELDKLKTYPGKKLLITSECYDQFFENDVLKNIATEISDGETIDTAKGEEIAKYVFFRNEDLSDEEYVNEMVSKSSKVIKSIIENPTSASDKHSLFNVLKTMEDEEQPYLAHSHQAFAIASMLILSLPNARLEYIDDIGYASLLHGFGLSYLNDPKSSVIFTKYINKSNLKLDIAKEAGAVQNMVDRHINGHAFLTFDDVGVYLKHFYVMEKVLGNTKFKQPRGLKKTVVDFKKMQIPKEMQIESISNPYYSARVFLIADHLISVLNELSKIDPNENTNSIMTKALKNLKQKTDVDKNPYPYDIEMIDHLVGVLAEQ